MGNNRHGIRVLCGFLLFVAVGCGEFFVDQTSSGGGGNNTGDYIYVGNGNNTFVAGFAVGSTGALSVLTNSPYNNGVAVICSAITPGNHFLYAGTTSGIFIYAINSNGSITVQNGGKIAAQDVVPTAMQVLKTSWEPICWQLAFKPHLPPRLSASIKSTALPAC